MLRWLLLALLFVPSGLLRAQSQNLDIYWIDVEGGAATLIVSPSGESMLIDTGFEVDALSERAARCFRWRRFPRAPRRDPATSCYRQ